MHPVLQKTFGGLTKQYYFRQLFFGMLLGVMAVSMFSRGQGPTPYGLWLFSLLSTLLYPYSRFVYESIAGFILGDNLFVVSAPLMLMVKFFTMLICWSGAIFIAPLGLAYLYFKSTQHENLQG